MRKLKFLTVANKRKIDAFLRKYLKEVISSEEYYNSISKCYNEAKRVKCRPNEFIRPSKISDWLRGLPIGTEYATYNICLMFIEAVMGKKDINILDNYIEDQIDLDDYYWNTLGNIIYCSYYYNKFN